MRFAVLAAMPSELRPFVKALGLDRSGDVFTGTLGADAVVATTMGVGMARATDAAERLLGTEDVDRVVVIGIAGGIDTSLPIAHVVTPEVIVDGGTRAEYHPAPWGPVVASGRLVTFDDFAAEMAMMPTLKREGFVAVDMETAAVAAVCERHGRPYSVFRAISDNATDGSIDAAIAGMARPDGSADVGAALRYLVRRPWRAARLARLGQGAQKGSQAAADAAITALRASSGLSG